MSAREITITPQQALQRTIEHREIFHDEMIALMRQIMAGEVSPLMTAAIITGLRVKKETVGEITGAARVMRELAHKVPVAGDDAHLLDIVGTGGDGASSFNISTASMFVAAAARASPSTADAACRRSPAAPTCWRRWVHASTSRPRRWRPALPRPASASCSHRTIIRR
jgi:hypothetical protein